MTRGQAGRIRTKRGIRTGIYAPLGDGRIGD